MKISVAWNIIHLLNLGAPVVQTTSYQENLACQIKGLSGLSPDVVKYVDMCPIEAQSVILVALENAAKQYTTPIPEALIPYLVPRKDRDNIITVKAASKKLDVSQSTVRNWIKKDKLLAWRANQGRYKIPSDQILGRRKILKGIAEVKQIIGDPVITWEFLDNETCLTDCFARPIDQLKKGKIEEVIGYAHGYGTNFT